MVDQYLSDLRKCIKELDVYVAELHAAIGLRTEMEELREIAELITTMEHRRAYYQTIFRSELSRKIHTAIDSYRTVEGDGQKEPFLRLVK